MKTSGGDLQTLQGPVSVLTTLFVRKPFLIPNFKFFLLLFKVVAFLSSSAEVKYTSLPSFSQQIFRDIKTAIIFPLFFLFPVAQQQMCQPFYTAHTLQTSWAFLDLFLFSCVTLENKVQNGVLYIKDGLTSDTPKLFCFGSINNEKNVCIGKESRLSESVQL